MDNTIRAHLQRFDRVSMLEPQLRDTLTAGRASAQQAVQDCFMNYSWKSDAVLTSGADYTAWQTALRAHRDYNQRLNGVVGKLTKLAQQLSTIQENQRRNEVAAHEANIAFFLSLDLHEEKKNTVSIYTYYMACLLEYHRTQAAGDYRMRPPQQPPQEVWNVVNSLLALNKTEQSVACATRRQELQQSLQDWQITSGQVADELKSVVSEIDIQGNALDQANLAAAQAVRTKLAAYSKQDPRMGIIGQSAVDTCNAVILLAKRVPVVLGHGPTAGDARQL